MDSFSPLAPSRIRVLVLPVGRIEHARFTRFLQRLQREGSIISLADVEPYASETDFDLTPKSFPQGSLSFSFTAANPSEQHLHLSPFELFREPLLVLGVVGGVQHEDEGRKSVLNSAATYLRERHSRVVHRQLLVLLEEDDDNNDNDNNAHDLAPALGIAKPQQDDHPALRDAICQTAARFLLELATYAKALQASPSISTPGQTARSLQRSKTTRDGDRRPASGYRTPTRGSDSQSPIEDGSPGMAELRSRGPPPTSFDQIQSANPAPSALGRSSSRASNPSDKSKANRPVPAQDRVSVQGFGSGTSQDKIRARGKARVGVVLGSIYMIAGHWNEALRVLIEHTSKLRSLSDQLWHGKGLENIAMCLLLLAWKGVEFQVPALLGPVSDRNSSSHVPRLSAIIPAEPTPGESSQQATVRRFAACVPDLTKTILALYRSVEGSLELPYIAIAEATVRFSRLLAVLANHAGTLSVAALDLLVHGLDNQSAEFYVHSIARRPAVAPKGLSRNAIADMLAQIIPQNDDDMAAADHISLLSAIAATYAVLGLERKKAMVIKDLVIQLRYALIRARKLGAAEMGIHPAASISSETGAETLLAIAEESGGINKLMANVSEIYSAVLLPESSSEPVFSMQTALHGNPALKFEILREFAALCEASPDPYGVLRLNASLLRAGGPNAALDPNAQSNNNAFSKEEQLQLATVISRTVAVSKHLGLDDALAMYWDPFLVRGVRFPPPRSHLSIIDRTKVKGPVDSRVPGNPLLYDPNASRPGTALPEVSVLVKDETSICVVSLQNPFDVSIEVESLVLVTEGSDLETSFESTTLGPLRVQSVMLAVNPTSVGETKIKGCNIRMHGCREQYFDIITAPWSAQAPLTLKDTNNKASHLENADSGQIFRSLGINTQIVSTATVDEMPLLELEEDEVVESGLMLLGGERRLLDIVLSNSSKIPAYIFEITDTAGVVRHIHGTNDQESGSRPSTAPAEVTIAPGASVSVHLEILGKAGISSTQVNFYYSATKSGASRQARLASVPLQLTINAALQVQNLDILPTNNKNKDILQVMFDLGNAWPHPISYSCSASSLPLKTDETTHDEEGQLSPGELRRLYVTVPRPTFDLATTPTDELLRTSFLNQLRINWTAEERHGQVDLLRLPLSPDAIALIRGPPVSLLLSLVDCEAPVTVGTFARIQLKLSERAKLGHPGPLAVQLIAHSPDGSAPSQDWNERRFAVVGTLRRVLPLFPDRGADESVVVDFVVCPLLSGTLEFEALVHPAWIGPYADELSESEDWHARTRVEIQVN